MTKSYFFCYYNYTFMLKEIDQNLIEKALEAGVIYGHHKSKTHPTMKSFVVNSYNEIEILNVEEILNSLLKAIEYFTDLAKKRNLVLLVGTKPIVYESINKLSEVFNWPKVTYRWLGGTLTNFPVIKSRIDFYLKFLKDKQEGEFEKYTKKERAKMEKELEKMKNKFEGLVNLTRLPDALFVIDPSENEAAILEAKKMNIPVIAILDNDDNLDLIDVPIIANDHSSFSINFIIDNLVENLKEVKNLADESLTENQNLKQN